MMVNRQQTFRSKWANMFVFAWAAMLLLTQVYVGAIAAAMATTPIIGALIIVIATALCAYRSARMRVEVGREGEVIVTNFFRRYRFTAGEVQCVDEHPPWWGRIMTRGYPTNWWIRVRLDSGSDIFPSALLRRLDRTEHEAFAAALGQSVERWQ